MIEKYDIQCPDCGKQLSLTVEEMLKTGGRAVCPQCLCEFMPAGISLPCAEVAVASPAPSPHVLFCHNCGERLPAADLRFCPYCGSALFSTPAVAIDAATSIEEKAVIAETALVDNVEAEPAELPASPTAELRQYRLKGAPMITTYKRQLSREDIMGPLWLRILCYCAILALLALFVVLVIAIINEP